MEDKFEWDEAKSDECLQRRGFDFAYAVRIFQSPRLERVDDRQPYGEERFQVLGRIEGALYVVVYTHRGPVRRIISARRARLEEAKKW